MGCNDSSSHQFCAATKKTVACLVLRYKPRNRRSDFETQITKPELPVLRHKLKNRRPWFWYSTNKLVLFMSLRMVHTAHDATCAWPSPVICTRSPTSAKIIIAVRHVAHATCTPRDKQTWFSTRNKNKGKTTEMSRIQIQTSACQWLITYQTNELITWFLNLSLNESIGNTTHKVWILNPRPHEAQLEDQEVKESSRRSSRRREKSQGQ
jgi:hypothetical protein